MNHTLLPLIEANETASDNSNGTTGPNIETEVADGVSAISETILKSIYLSIGVIGITGNTMVILVMVFFTSMKKRLANWYMINQSILDLLASILILLMAVFVHSGKNLSGVGGDLLCRFWLTRWPLWSVLMSSTYNLLTLTIERYIELVHPIYHKINFSKDKVIISLVVVWLIGPLYNLAFKMPTTFVIDGVCYPFSIWPNPSTQQAVGILTIFLQWLFPIIVIAVSYTKIALFIRKRMNAVHPANQGPQIPGTSNTTKTNAMQNNRKKKMERAQKNVIKTLVIVSMLFIFCWTWNEMFILLYFIGYPTDFGSAFYHFTVIAVFSNCCVNPIIYSAKFEEFQKGLKKMFCKKCTQQTSFVNESIATVTVPG